MKLDSIRETHLSFIKENRTSLIIGLFTLIAIHVLFLLMKHDLLTGDGGSYVRWSISSNFWTHGGYGVEWNPWLPLYAFCLRVLHIITFGFFPQQWVAIVFNTAIWYFCLVYVWKIGNSLKLQTTKLFVLVIAVFPTVIPMQVVAIPSKYMLVLFLMFASIFYLINRHWIRFLIICALGLVSWKGVWLFYFSISIYAVIRHKYPPLYVLLSGLPLFIYYLFVVLYFHSLEPLLIFNRNDHILLGDASISPIFPGIIGGFFDTTSSMIKVIFLIPFVLLGFYLFIVYLIRKEYLYVSILFTFIIMSSVTSEYEVNVLAKYAVGCVIFPTFVYLDRYSGKLKTIIQHPLIYWSIGCCGVFANLAMAYFWSLAVSRG